MTSVGRDTKNQNISGLTLLVDQWNIIFDRAFPIVEAIVIAMAARSDFMLVGI
jgi:hypothetical protein